MSTGLSVQAQAIAVPAAHLGWPGKLADDIAEVARSRSQAHSISQSEMSAACWSASSDEQPAASREATAQTTPVSPHTGAMGASELGSCHCYPVSVPNSENIVAVVQGSSSVSPETKITKWLCHSLGNEAPLHEPPITLQCTGKSPSRPQANKSSEDYSAGTTEDRNRALRILNLPGDITCAELLSYIVGMGRVYATEINKPATEKDIITASAKLEFFTHDAANAFRIAAWRDALVIRGLPACVTWFPSKSHEITASGDASRVLVVHGLSSFVNAWYLKRLFSAWFPCDIARIITHVDTGYWAKVELLFGGYYQANAARAVLGVELPGVTWDVGFGIDPCAWTPEKYSRVVDGCGEYA